MRKLDKSLIVFITFFLVLFNIPFWGIGQTGLALPQNNIAWMFVVVIIAISLLQIPINKEVFKPAKTKPLIIGTCLALVPFLVTSFSDFSLNNSMLPVALIATVLFYFSLMQFQVLRAKPELILLLVLTFCSVQILHGFYQTSGVLLHNFLTNGQKFDPAPLGVFNQKNVFASLMATGVAMSGYALMRNHTGSDLQLRLLKKWLLTIAFLGSFLLVFSNSRVGYISLLVAVGLISVYMYNQDVKIFRSWAALIVIGVLLGSIAVYFNTRVEKDLFVDNNRVAIYLTSLNMILDAPFLGHGLGSFERLFLESYPETLSSGLLSSGANITNLSHPHNELLLWGVEGGVVSALGLVIIAYSFLSLIFKLKYEKVCLYFGLLFPITFHCMTELPFYLSVTHLIILVMLLVYMVIRERCLQSILAPGVLLSRLVKSISTICIVVATTFFISNVYSITVVSNYLNSSERDFNQLSKVINTAGWDNAFNAVYKGTIMNHGINSKNEDQIRQYIDWVEPVLNSSPRLEYYQNLVVAYEQLGEYEKAISVVEDIKYYYPNNPNVANWQEGFYKTLHKKGIKVN